MISYRLNLDMKQSSLNTSDGGPLPMETGSHSLFVNISNVHHWPLHSMKNSNEFS